MRHHRNHTHIHHRNVPNRPPHLRPHPPPLLPPPPPPFSSFGFSFEFGNRANHRVEERVKKSDFKLYDLRKIAKALPSDFQQEIKDEDQSALMLRLSIFFFFTKLFKKIMIDYYSSRDLFLQNQSSRWNIKSTLNNKPFSFYMTQVIRPTFLMKTEFKLKIISHLFRNSARSHPIINIKFNRFEQQNFMEKINNNNNNGNNSLKNVHERPLFLQFMMAVELKRLPLLVVGGQNPFTVTCVDEHGVDFGGPGRELFSSLFVELMNSHIGVFTINPNKLHDLTDTNKEDMIPNKNFNDIFADKKHSQLFKSRFIYAGALIGICIVSKLPQPIRLASFIWEYLINETVSIESIYEIDKSFEKLIKKAESLLNSDSFSSMNDDDFKSLFSYSFEITDSFDKNVELVSSGSSKSVTKENLNDFIESAKKFRIHEFDEQLADLKKGFEIITGNKNIICILHPDELKLLVCGETECKVEQMKIHFVVNVNDPDKNVEYVKKMKEMFWNVMESFSVDERMQFIKFASGNLGLPPAGMKWERPLVVNILSKDQKESVEKKLPTSHTCFFTISIPFFESEEELAKILRKSFEFSGGFGIA